MSTHGNTRTHARAHTGYALKTLNLRSSTSRRHAETMLYVKHKHTGVINLVISNPRPARRAMTPTPTPAQAHLGPTQKTKSYLWEIKNMEQTNI